MPILYEPPVDIVGEGHKVLYGTGLGPPTAASDGPPSGWNVGDIIWNKAPSNVGAPMAYRCAVAGTVGTWETVGTELRAGVTLTNAQVLGMFVTPVLAVPAPPAGCLIEIVSVLFENVYLTGAFAAGGAIAVYYGSAASVVASATVAATFLTAPAANQVILVAGALATNLASAVTGLGIYVSNATQAFTTGGGTLQVRVTYRVHSAL